MRRLADIVIRVTDYVKEQCAAGEHRVRDVQDVGHFRLRTTAAADVSGWMLDRIAGKPARPAAPATPASPRRDHGARRCARGRPLEPTKRSGSMHDARIFHVNVNCTDLERSRRFYADALGLDAAVRTTPDRAQPGAAFGLDTARWDAWVLVGANGFDGGAVDLLE